MTKQDFGSYLRQKRKQKKFSIVQLSQLSGVSNPYISQLENNKFKPSFEIIKKLTKGLELNFYEAAWMADLYTDEEYRQSKLENDFLNSLSLEEQERFIEKQINAQEESLKIDKFRRTRHINVEDFINNDLQYIYINGHKLTNEKIMALTSLFEGLEKNYPSDEEIVLEFKKLQKTYKAIQQRDKDSGTFTLNYESLIFDLD